MPHPEIELGQFKIAITFFKPWINQPQKLRKTRQLVENYPASFGHFNIDQLSEIVATVRREPWKLEHKFHFNKRIYTVTIYHDEISDPKSKEKFKKFSF